MGKSVVVIEGDDAAPEAMRPVVELLGELAPQIQFEYPPVGERGNELHGNPFSPEAKATIDQADTTLFGSTSGSSGAALQYLRWGKQTFANVRPCTYLPGCSSPLSNPQGIDFVIVRENLEDLYVGIEGDLEELQFLDRVGRTVRKRVRDFSEGRYAVKVITESGTSRVVRFACELARERDLQNKVTCVTKHNMLRGTDGYFLELARTVASEYADIEFESFIVDDFACRLIREPQRYDVIVMPNLYGDILSDAAGGLLGSLGLAASGCYGHDYAYFEPAHGTAPDIAGTNTINPTATILSSAMMLEYLGLKEQAKKLRTGVEKVYSKGDVLTPDQGGASTTTEFVDAVWEQCC